MVPLSNSGIRLIHLLGLDSLSGHPGFKFYPQKNQFRKWGKNFEGQFLGFLAKKRKKRKILLKFLDFQVEPVKLHVCHKFQGSSSKISIFCPKNET